MTVEPALIDLRLTTVKHPLPDFIADGLVEYAKASNNYHHQPDDLRMRLARKHGVSPEMIQLTAGADQAIFLLAQAFGSRSQVFTPTYVGYSDIKNFGYELQVHNCLEATEYKIPTENMGDASLIIFANPNNPAGLTKRTDILRLVASNPQAHVVVDEAYGDFAEESVTGDIAEHKNLVVIRSFSKSHSLAGFRIGYVVAHPEVLQKITHETSWFNVAYTSVGAANVALDHEEYFAEKRQELIDQRELTQTLLSQNGFQVIPTKINAVLIQCADNAAASGFVERMKSAGILVSQGNGGSNFGLADNFVRISIGTREQMESFRANVAMG